VIKINKFEMKKLLIIGGKGNGTLVLTVVENINKFHKEWEVLGFLNDREVDPIMGFPILGKVEPNVVNKYLKDPEVYFFYALISVKLNFNFLPKLESLKIPRTRFATLVDPSAVIANNVKIGYGTCISPLCCINSYSRIGDFVQIWSQVIIATGAILKNYSYVAANSYIGAYVEMSEGAYVGPSVSILEFVKMGKWSLAGMGSVVVKDVPEYTKVVGNPSRIIGEVK